MQAKPNAVKQALMVEGLEVEDFGGSVQVGSEDMSAVSWC